ncbi:MAG: serine/threonine protein kinase [Chloroflexi bacterium]|nr:serine/threonine protein kinase [Chloroflexota bacterium]
MELLGEKLGNYEIVQLIAQGGMAAVYRANQVALNRSVAIKVLSGLSAGDEVFRQRFDREAKAVAQLSHPNIVPIYDFGSDDARGLWYIVMEYVPGGSLRDLVSGAPGIDEATRLIAQVAYGLDYAHTHGIIHRDIKPGNILLTELHRPMLTDFGLAKMDSHPQFTEAGLTIGTPAYMSPEQVMGGDLDKRSDIYSLAMVLYELLTGRAPFRSDTPLALLHQQVYEAPEPPRRVNPRIPRKLEKVLMRAMSKDREGRYASAAEFAAALERTLGGNTVSLASVAGTRAIPPPPKHRLPWLAALHPARMAAAARTAGAQAAEWLMPRARRVLSRLWRWTWRAALVAAIVAVAVTAGLVLLLSNYAERTISASRADWGIIGGDQPVLMDRARVEGAVEQYMARNGLTLLMNNPQLQLAGDDAATLSGDGILGPLRVDGRVFVMGGAVQVEIERVNGYMPYVYGTLISDGINRGLRTLFASGPVRLEHIEAAPGTLIFFPKHRTATDPALAPSPTPRP